MDEDKIKSLESAATALTRLKNNALAEIQGSSYRDREVSYDQSMPEEIATLVASLPEDAALELKAALDERINSHQETALAEVSDSSYVPGDLYSQLIQVMDLAENHNPCCAHQSLRTTMENYRDVIPNEETIADQLNGESVDEKDIKKAALQILLPENNSSDFIEKYSSQKVSKIERALAHPVRALYLEKLEETATILGSIVRSTVDLPYVVKKGDRGAANLAVYAFAGEAALAYLGISSGTYLLAAPAAIQLTSLTYEFGKFVKNWFKKLRTETAELPPRITPRQIPYKLEED